jgi:galactonate dehydratase
MQSAPGVPALESDGCVALPNGPGLGVDVDEALIAAHPSRKVHFNLFAADWQKRDTRSP